MATATMSSLTLEYMPSGKHHDTLFSLQKRQVTPPVEALSGFPSEYKGERVWVGSEMALKQDEWMINLSENDNMHIMDALRHFQGLNLGPEHLSPTTFPLPQELSQRLKRISHDCYEGRGFATLRGICPDDFTDAENVLVFGGVSSHVAPKRGFQHVNREKVTCHVYSDDTKPGAKEQQLKPAFTNEQLAFHTDLGDILTLYTKDISNTGGETMIVSSSKIYNALAKEHPDLLQEFASDWTFYHTQSYKSERTPLVSNAPGDKLIFQYSRLPVTGFRKSAPNSTLPPPTAKRIEAMAKLEEIGRKYAFPLPRQPGDIAFINNMCLMHGRTAFDIGLDGNSLPSKRHLVKLMLQDPELSWELPECLAWYRERIYGANQADGGRIEKWESIPASKDPLTGAVMWAGSGATANG